MVSLVLLWKVSGDYGMDIHVELSGGMLNIEVWAGERFECHLYLDVDGSQWRREVYPEREVGLGQSPKER